MKFDVGWSSHIPVILKVFQASSGPVLELGTGLYSTPILHYLCINANRELISYENNEKYFGLSKQYETDRHKIYFVEQWQNIFIERQWGLAFVDHQPDERRIDEIKRLANLADYIIVHDSQKKDDRHYHYSQIYSLFKYRWNYKALKLHTVVLSNTKDMKEL